MSEGALDQRLHLLLHDIDISISQRIPVGAVCYRVGWRITQLAQVVSYLRRQRDISVRARRRNASKGMMDASAERWMSV